MSKSTRVPALELQRHNFLTRYSGQKLLKEHSLEEEGLWQVFGEDPNCDFGGSHHQPNLGFFSGRLTDVIDAAVELSGFWAWGAGGDIRKVSQIKKVDDQSAKKRAELKSRRAEVQQELDRIDNELKGL